MMNDVDCHSMVFNFLLKMVIMGYFQWQFRCMVHGGTISCTTDKHTIWNVHSLATTKNVDHPRNRRPAHRTFVPLYAFDVLHDACWFLYSTRLGEQTNKTFVLLKSCLSRKAAVALSVSQSLMLRTGAERWDWPCWSELRYGFMLRYATFDMTCS